ncbi:hypothetical protein ACFLWB_01955 [Chloroflexota bacterium]
MSETVSGTLPVERSEILNHTVVLPAGMELEVTPESVDGDLRAFQLRRKTEGKTDVKGWPPVKEGGGVGITWKVMGSPQKPTTYQFFLYGSKGDEEQSGNYQITWRTYDRGDMGLHLDAGEAIEDRMDLPQRQSQIIRRISLCYGNSW